MGSVRDRGLRAQSQTKNCQAPAKTHHQNKTTPPIALQATSPKEYVHMLVEGEECWGVNEMGQGEEVGTRSGPKEVRAGNTGQGGSEPVDHRGGGGSKPRDQGGAEGSNRGGPGPPQGCRVGEGTRDKEGELRPPERTPKSCWRKGGSSPRAEPTGGSEIRSRGVEGSKVQYVGLNPKYIQG